MKQVLPMFRSPEAPDPELSESESLSAFDLILLLRIIGIEILLF